MHLVHSVNKPPEYEKYIKSAQWRNISELLKEKAGYVCAHCRRGSTTLEVHHLTYERFGRERLGDLVVLCKPCHEAADEKRVAEGKARGESARFDSAYCTYVTKKYGEDEFLSETLHHREEFEDWLREKQDSGNDDYPSLQV